MPEYPEYPRLLVRAWLAIRPPPTRARVRTQGDLTGVAPSQAEGVHWKAQATGRRATRTMDNATHTQLTYYADHSGSGWHWAGRYSPHPACRARRGYSTICAFRGTPALGSGSVVRPDSLCAEYPWIPFPSLRCSLGVLGKLRPSTFSGLGPAAPQQQSKSVHLRSWSKTAALSGRSAHCIAIIPQSYRD